MRNAPVRLAPSYNSEENGSDLPKTKVVPKLKFFKKFETTTIPITDSLEIYKVDIECYRPAIEKSATYGTSATLVVPDSYSGTGVSDPTGPSTKPNS